MDVVETTIIGAGVVGTAVAHELSKNGREVFVIEKNPGVTRGENQSSRNPGVIHSGLYYDQATRPLKAELCVLGNQMLYAFCRAHEVPHLRCGKLMVATSESDWPNIELYLARARANGVEARMLDREEVTDREPNVQILGALYLPSTGVVDPTRLVYQLFILASNHGAHFLTETELVGIRPRVEGLELTVRNRYGSEETFLSKEMINSAGLYADEVARMLNPASQYQVDPMRCEFARFYRTKRPDLMCDMNVYPAPFKVDLPSGSYWTVGTHLTPTIEPAPNGGWTPGPIMTAGPISFPARGKEDFGGEFRPISEYFDTVSSYFPGLRESDLEPYQVGVLAYLSGHLDWLIQRDEKHPSCIHLLGMGSPALTSCLALADHVRRVIDGLSFPHTDS
jgi:L-2-hydroxyglutarate oxidase LhgO